MEKPMFSKELGAEKKDLAQNHWFRVAERLYSESGKVPDSLEIRSAAVIEAFGIPSGEASALETDTEAQRTNLEKDKIIAEYLTNKAGVVIDKEKGIVSLDFRDMYPGGLPQELKNVLDLDTLAIMEAEYEHEAYTREIFGDTKDFFEADKPVHYFRLPGGIDVFLRGYAHHEQWHRKHSAFLGRINKHAAVIGIEGFTDKPFGDSLEAYWQYGNDPVQASHYDALMREAAAFGFRGFFTEIDARDISKVNMSSESFFGPPHFPYLPEDFFEHYFMFLQKEHPALMRHIKTPQDLRRALVAQSVVLEGGLARGNSLDVFRNGKEFYEFPYYAADADISLEPTFLELGQKIFSDALAAIKLHIIAKLMADSHLPKGPVVDYEGVGHLSSRSFFLRYPKYAMGVVLRTVNELMAGTVKEDGNIAEIYKVFQNPDWAEIVKEIARLAFKSVSEDGRALQDFPADFLKIYNINPEKVIPSDEEIQNIRNKIAAAGK